MIKTYLLSFIIRFFMTILGTTCRICFVEGEESFKNLVSQKKPVIFSFWHNRIFYLSYFLYKYCHKKGLPLSVLISQSKDGGFIANIVEQWKGRAIRGSSSKGGYSAIKGLIKSVRDGYAIVTTPDGPRGPVYEFQSGSIYLSSVLKIPIIPVACSFEKAWVFNSWDKFMIPKPFSRIYVHIGQPSQIDDQQDQEEQRLKLEKYMKDQMPEFYRPL